MWLSLLALPQLMMAFGAAKVPLAAPILVASLCWVVHRSRSPQSGSAPGERVATDGGLVCTPERACYAPLGAGSQS